MSMWVFGIVVAAGRIVAACSLGDCDRLPPPGSDGSRATDAAEDTSATEPPNREAPSNEAPTGASSGVGSCADRFQAAGPVVAPPANAWAFVIQS